jgi:hypothetical protein
MTCPSGLPPGWIPVGEWPDQEYLQDNAGALGGRTRLYTWPRVGLADEASSETVPDAAGG